MTCIVGFSDKINGCTYLGCDSMGSNGYTQSIYSQSKAFHHSVIPNVVIGGTGTFRHLDLLQYGSGLFPELDKYKEVEFDRAYMVKTFIPNLIQLFQNNIPSEAEKDRGGNFLIGIKEKLFIVQSDYSVLEPANNFASVGCGEVAAMGSLLCSTNYIKTATPVEHIRYALESAESECCGVRRPLRIINTENDEEIIIE